MTGFVLRRLAIGIPTLLLLIVLSFFLMHVAPGNPFYGEKKLPAEVMRNIMARYGLDKPLWQQLWEYVWNIVAHFDFGPSFKYKDRTVNDIIAQGFPVTLTYGFWSFIVAAGIGIPLGMIAAIRQNSWADYLAVGVGVGAQVVPNFVLAPILVLVFTLWLHWLPGGGWNDGRWNYVILPVAALATTYIANIARLMRSSMLEVLHSNYVRTARAKGLPGYQVILKHALKPALLPVISYLGPLAISSITAALVTETIFSLPGIGKLIVNGAGNRDYTLVLGLVVLITVLAVFLNLLVDLAYALLDPKIRY